MDISLSVNPPRKDFTYIFFIAFFGTFLAVLIILRIDAWHRESLFLATQAALPGHQNSESASRSMSKSASLLASQSVTEGTKTYRNKEYGFEFEYPGDWGIGDESGFGVRLEPLTNKKSERISIGISASHDRFSQQEIKTLPEWLAQFPGAKCEKEKVINGYRWCVVLERFEAVRADNYGMTAKGVDYIAGLNVGYGRQAGDYYLPDNELEEELNVLSKILSSFTLIEKTVGWKTYKNTEQGFEFIYPGDATIDTSNPDTEVIRLVGGALVNIQHFTPDADFINSLRSDVFISQNEIEIGSFKAWQTRGAGSGGNYFIQTWWEKNGLVYYIQFDSSGPAKGEDIREFNLLLSTFKFIK